MSTQSMLLLTILTEAVLEDILVDEITALGAKGYTISEARGRGTHGVRTGKWSAGGNIRIEILGDSELCTRIADRLQANYERDYGLLMFTSAVELQN
ncbi:MAG: transcriptional regulator [Pseudomonadota bacterium]|nr:transcriptional regulator [Pseudomonadota bacterium]MDP1903052.1 transcriptional regulator [Pseudomonadota bacterium]MDP2353968.1 transcriptional regulator [Pseudomonadota bacterium]